MSYLARLHKQLDFIEKKHILIGEQNVFKYLVVWNLNLLRSA